MEQLTTKRAPRVFMSYSHDSVEHRRWVAELAAALVEGGVDIILDQWNLRLGEDIAKFMERAITSADRVLMVCTKRYVKKANAGKGGAGYEAMIVTGEMLRGLGTAKFIPVVRQQGSVVLPRFLSTRHYVDLGNSSTFREHFDHLLQDLRGYSSSRRLALHSN